MNIESWEVILEKKKAFIASQARDIKILQVEYQALLGERKALKDMLLERDAEIERLKAAMMEIIMNDDCGCADGTYCPKCICRDAVEGE